MSKSDIEAKLFSQIKSSGLPIPEREFKFHPVRRFRFDFAWVNQRVAAEVEGGTWSGGRHVRGSGYRSDCEKYNLAVLNGWRVYRFTTDMISDKTAIKILKRELKDGCC